MATLRITNLMTTIFACSDIGSPSIPVGGYRDVERRVGEIASMQNLGDRIAAGDCSLRITLTAAERASGLLAPPMSVEAEDIAPVASGAVEAPLMSYFVEFAALTTGTADDVAMYLADNLPRKSRILRATLFVKTAVGSSTITVNSRAAGAGTNVATFDSGSTGLKNSTAPTSTTVLTPGSLEGLYVRRSDRAVAGWVLIEYRPET